jgi:hypothetical protein
MLNSAKQLKKLQQLALKNKDKVAAGVNKATDVIDKKTGGKHTDKLKKLDAAAAKFAGQTPDIAADAGDAPPAATTPVAPTPAPPPE